jgi:sulfite reductase (NADPH) flavoprotein alpha-component
MSYPALPDTAPFPSLQRAWLSGYLAGMFSSADSSAADSPAAPPVSAPPAKEEEHPWHDSAMPMAQRLKLAEGKPRRLQLMAAMAQLDCGSCGYLCDTYAKAIDSGAEKDITRCTPGGAETAKMLRQIMATTVEKTETPADIRVKDPSAPAPAATTLKYDRKHPFPARLLENRPLTAPEASKETRHLIFDLKGSNLTFEPGDALGIHPENSLETVDQIVELLGATGAEDVTSPLGTPLSLREALLRECLITQPRRTLLELLLKHASHWAELRELQKMLDADEMPAGLQVIDLLRDCPSARPGAAEFVAALSALQPRLYSIASSPRAHPNQVHLTVGIVRYVNSAGTKCFGVASTYLADRVRPGQKVRIFIQPSHRFRLPANPDMPIIMVGPGTGIAPFRAFLQERQSQSAKGRNWLLFGEQHERFNFLYRDELMAFHKSGLLTKLDTAFSRDQAEKIYVQHRLLEQGSQIWQWLQEGANFYICGARDMATDVDTALRRIVNEQGKRPWPEAEAYVDEMLSSKRYQRDVY